MQIDQGSLKNAPGALQSECRHDYCDDEVRPTSTRAKKMPSAASRTVTLPRTSLRVQIHAECMLESPSRYAQSCTKEAALAASAVKPTAPMVKASGSVP
jgi:hypothetical protein